MDYLIYICMYLFCFIALSPENTSLLHMVHIRIRKLILVIKKCALSARRLLQIPSTSFEGVWM